MENRVMVGPGRGGLWYTMFPLEIPGSSANEVTIRHGFLGALRVLVDGERAKQGPQRAQYLVPTSTGGYLELTLKPGFSGTSPVVVNQTNTAIIGRRIVGAEWLWVGLPLLLPAFAILGRGGLVDIIVGFLAFSSNVRIFLNDGFTVAERYLCSLVSMGLFAIIYFAVTLARDLFL